MPAYKPMPPPERTLRGAPSIPRPTYIIKTSTIRSLTPFDQLTPDQQQFIKDNDLYDIYQKVINSTLNIDAFLDAQNMVIQANSSAALSNIKPNLSTREYNELYNIYIKGIKSGNLQTFNEAYNMTVQSIQSLSPAEQQQTTEIVEVSPYGWYGRIHAAPKPGEPSTLFKPIFVETPSASPVFGTALINKGDFKTSDGTVYNIGPDASPQDTKAFKIALSNAERLAKDINKSVNEPSKYQMTYLSGKTAPTPSILQLTEYWNSLFQGDPAFILTIRNYYNTLKTGDKDKIQSAYDKLISEYLALNMPFWSDVYNNRRLSQAIRILSSPVTQAGIAFVTAPAFVAASRAPGLTGTFTKWLGRGALFTIGAETGFQSGLAYTKVTTSTPQPFNPLINYGLTTGLTFGSSIAGAKLSSQKVYDPFIKGPTLGQKLYSRLTRGPSPIKETLTTIRKTTTFSKFLEYQKTVPGRAISQTSRKYLGDRSTGITKSTEFQSLNLYGRVSRFSGRGKSIRMTSKDIFKYRPRSKLSMWERVQPESVSRNISFEKVYKPSKSIFGKYKVKTAEISLEAKTTFPKTEQLVRLKPSAPSEIKPLDLAAKTEIKGKLAWKGIKELAAGERKAYTVPSVTESQYKANMEAIVKGIGERRPEIRTGFERSKGIKNEYSTRSSFSGIVAPKSELAVGLEIPKQSTTSFGKQIFGRSQSIKSTEIFKVPEISSTLIPISIYRTFQTPFSTYKQTQIPISKQKQQQLQYQQQLQIQQQQQTQFQQQKQLLELKTNEVRRQRVSTMFSFKAPTTTSTTVTAPFIFLPPEETRSKLGKSFNVYVKKQATKPSKHWTKVNRSPLDYLSALGAGAYNSKNTASRSFKLSPAKGPSTSDAFYSQYWRQHSYQFYLKNGIYIQKSQYSISTLGEVQQITFAPRFKQQLKPIKMGMIKW